MHEAKEIEIRRMMQKAIEHCIVAKVTVNGTENLVMKKNWKFELGQVVVELLQREEDNRKESE